MNHPRIGLVTCLRLPEPDPDEAILTEALAERGAVPRVVAWDDPRVIWSELDIAVLRSTWNYHRHRDEFVAWADLTAKETKLFNPPEIVRWNSHKKYLADLEKRGIRVVPTEHVERGSNARLEEIQTRRGWDDVVVKPAVSAGSFDTHRVQRGSDKAGEAERNFARMVAERDVMVQRYVRSVDGYGERSMMIIDGELTHAIRKTPRFAGGSEQVSGEMPIAADERELALSIWAGLPPGLLYGRIDLARGDDETPMVMELEVIEPSLFFLQCRPALERFVEALLNRARSLDPRPPA